MNNKSKILIFLVIALYIIGNNQISHAYMLVSKVSHSSIVFEKAYIPQQNNPSFSLIPDGNNIVTKYSKSGELPNTGEKMGIGWKIIGLVLIITSLSIKIHIRRFQK